MQLFVATESARFLLLGSAAAEFDTAVRIAGAVSPLRKLGGMMVLQANHGPSSGWRNVEFHRLFYRHPSTFSNDVVAATRIASVRGMPRNAR
jgi:hypothetical protein